MQGLSWRWVPTRHKTRFDNRPLSILINFFYDDIIPADLNQPLGLWITYPMSL